MTFSHKIFLRCLVSKFHHAGETSCALHVVIRTLFLKFLFININQPDALNFIISLFQASTCFEHIMLIVRRAKLCYTVSGIITPIGVMIPETV